MPTNILMPALSPTMEEGTLAKWHVKEGDEVKSGDVIAEIETDKATMEVEAVDEGRIGKLLVAEGTEGVAVNKPIAILLEEGEEAADIDNAPPPKKDEPKTSAKPEAKEVEKPRSSATPSSDGNARPTQATGTGHRVFASPLARRIAEQQGIDLSAISGSGPNGRIVKADLEGAAKAAPKKQAAGAVAQGAAQSIDPRAYYAEGTFEEVSLDGMRRTIARRLTQSMQEIPHFYLTIDCELDELLKARKKLNDEAGEGVKLSVNDFLIRAAALALIKVPDANVSFAGNALLKHKSADIGIAVALEGGLITPIIRNADKKGLAEISNEAKELAERARNKKLKPNEYEGGSFSISNLGMFGIKHFTAVINPPQAAILAVGKGEERPVVRNGKVEVATIMTVTMSCDHRAIDGALGARFLEAFRSFVEYPARMLL
ncbi:pyruvate dehydrogenase complex dihydrolipoamide acetyltransferase [Parvibaculum lavamentivorans DS-1]|uniref:Acetyltransferase component of pyruvate dehydrogenase complex n=1 Tax=Parvibaculum lavamentivorans (strain DS-1 / DSM 13023 / NCIMB 13966) TaxID=402881 RepID=A7HXW3_PARL1|nr:pyruvate dehydrogenase complex dihydrolipoamide acetyltransferase [Parvibaculum lavamentivorans]ABS64746.1 pyruvate dehydrogenase complex dihydrolipoamide acetyltransferase [Parvibaculum lavamentivorans DS-1]